MNRQLSTTVILSLVAAQFALSQTPEPNRIKSALPSGFDLLNPSTPAIETRGRMPFLGLDGPAAPRLMGRAFPDPPWLKNLTVESFGLGPALLAPGFDRSPAYFASLFDHHGLECPGCSVGPLNRAFTLPAFGSNATLKLRDGRTELYAGIGGVNALRPASTVRNDAWVAQAQVGGRFWLDRNQRISLGGVARYFYNLGPDPGRFPGSGMYINNFVPIPKRGFTFGGNALFRLGR